MLIALQKLFAFSFNESLSSSQFSPSFKCANITPIFKEQSRNHENNYRPVSILPVVSKIFEKLMNNQLSTYFEKILLNFSVVSRKVSVPNTASFWWLKNGNMLSISVKSLELYSQIYLKDLTVNLLIAKLNAYGPSLSALKLVHSYLQKRKQRTKNGIV